MTISLKSSREVSLMRAAGHVVAEVLDRMRSTVAPGVTTNDLDRIARALIDRGAPYGPYHCVNSGQTTWYGLAEEIARLLGREPRLAAVKVADVQMRATRPQYCALSNRKLAKAGVPMPSWQDSLSRYLTVVRQRGE